jgi:hypothetical protein
MVALSMKEDTMLYTKFKTASILSAIIAILAIVASAGGLFIDHLYRDGLWAMTAFRATNLVTLVIAAPLLIAAVLLAEYKSEEGEMLL